MKKLLVLTMIALLALSLSACKNMCHDCYKITDEGYEIFDGYYCKDCLFDFDKK